ncbi:HPr family phosphocarrier protein [Brevibacillus choshinensis]|uniref:Phosphocarrier protein HPr n=1 Tax=Brevibacillus choshinensis TaxID=54911 RepID=A0ABX7FPD0_BRECH|nr:HPr family phosphocarrier protein [Brevibacillus choshinensis]QRG67550.1 HPr family phosphocarrier protein [Brevibacillus choshinensis]
MIRINVEVTVSGGLHARPASVLVHMLNQHQSSVKMIYNGKEANGKSILSVMALGVKAGDELSFEVDGPDEQEAIAHIENLFERDFSA